MATLDILRTLKRAAKLLVLAGAVTPYASFPQTVFEPPTSTDRGRQIVEKIEETQSQGGPYSESLIELWTALRLVYEEEGLRTLAAAAIEQARQVVRANHGLYSLEEAPLISQAIANARARGDIEAAWNLEQDLLSLAQRYPEDLRTVPILREIADRRLDLLRRYVAGEIPPEIVLGCYYRGGPGPLPPSIASSEGRPSCDSGSRSGAIRSLRQDTLSHYLDAIEVIVRNGLYSSDELRELEMQVIRMSYSSPYYDFGIQSYRRLILYDDRSSAPWLTRITTLVELADWHLLAYWRWRSRTAGARDAVLESYEQAYDLLEQKGVAQASIDELFAPETPVVLPTFLPNPFASRDPSESARYIDVAFDITKYGRSEHADILATTRSATDAEKKDVLRLIDASWFRPRVTDGRFADATRAVVRYYLDGRGVTHAATAP